MPGRASSEESTVSLGGVVVYVFVSYSIGFAVGCKTGKGVVKSSHDSLDDLI